MPRQDFKCPLCGTKYPNVYYPLPEYDADHNRISEWPTCQYCATTPDGDRQIWPFDPSVTVVYQPLEPFPRVMSHDLLTGGLGLSVDDAAGRSVNVSSLQEIRTIEKESLRRAANGDGSPLVFRGFSQNKSNMASNTLKGSSFEKNQQVALPKGGVRTRAGAIRARATESKE